VALSVKPHIWFFLVLFSRINRLLFVGDARRRRRRRRRRRSKRKNKKVTRSILPCSSAVINYSIISFLSLFGSPLVNRAMSDRPLQGIGNESHVITVSFSFLFPLFLFLLFRPGIVRELEKDLSVSTGDFCLYTNDR